MKDNKMTWMTYKQAGQRYGLSAQAIRQRAIRGNWQRRYNLKGEALVNVLQIENENNLINQNTHHSNINKANRASDLWNALHDANDILRYYVDNSLSPRDNSYHRYMIDMFDKILWGDDTIQHRAPNERAS